MGAVIGAALSPLLAGVLHAIAGLFPGTFTAVITAWLAVFLYIVAVQRGASYAALFLSGLLHYAIVWFWLPETLGTFFNIEGFKLWLVVGVFISISACQLICFRLLFKLLPDILEKFALRSAFAWVSAAVLWPRVFPWDMGHTQLAFLPFIQIAEIGGVTLITFFMFWLSEGLLNWKRGRSSSFSALLPCAFMLGALVFGLLRLDQYNARGPHLNIAAVQASNASAVLPEDLRERLLRISKETASDSDLVIWPAIDTGIHVDERIQNAAESKELSTIRLKSPLLLGASTRRDQNTRFSSVLLLRPGGRIAKPYHKQSLLPFTEYLPLRDKLPWPNWLRSFFRSPLTPGSGPVVFPVRSSSSPKIVNVSPLICYEDINPERARSAVLAGAELLVDMASGTWASSPTGLWQHYALAAFRSIENRRTLLRSSAVGITAAIDPAGRATIMDEPSKQSTLRISASANSELTIFTRYVGEKFWQIFAVIVLLLGIAHSLFHPWRSSASLVHSEMRPASL